MRWAAVLFCAVWLAACGPRGGPDKAAEAAIDVSGGDPAAFLDGLYKRYYNDQAADDVSAFAERAQIYDKALLALMEEDIRLHPGEVPALDGDPLCNCQDFEAFTAAMTVENETSTTARVKTRIGNGSGEYRREEEQLIDLVVEDSAWRIHDITGENGSLVAFLQKANAEAKATAGR